MTSDDWFIILAVFICLLLSAFFSGSETALTASSRASMLRLEKQGNHRARIVNRLLDARERMLGATPYPLEVAPYASTRKTRAMQDAAAELGLPWQLPPLAVSFAPAPGATPGLGLPIVDPPYGNLHGRQRTTCRLCGECDIGCNIGAKNSLDYNYLSAARHHGADLRTDHEVRAIRPRPASGYEVD